MSDLQAKLAAVKETKQKYFTRTRRTGYQVGDKILRPNNLGEYFPESKEEIEAFDSLKKQGYLFDTLEDAIVEE